MPAMSNRPRIYIAGPLSQGDRLQNVTNAVEMMTFLIHNGYAPFCPHLSHYADPDDSLGHSTWLDVDLPWVACADAVLRLPGPSAGADREVEHARSLGIPVYEGVRDLFMNVEAP